MTLKLKVKNNSYMVKIYFTIKIHFVDEYVKIYCSNFNRFGVMSKRLNSKRLIFDLETYSNNIETAGRRCAMSGKLGRRIASNS